MRVIKILGGPSEKHLGIPRRVLIDGMPSISYTYFDSSFSKFNNILSFVNNVILQEWKYIMCFIIFTNCI